MKRLSVGLTALIAFTFGPLAHAGVQAYCDSGNSPTMTVTNIGSERSNPASTCVSTAYYFSGAYVDSNFDGYSTYVYAYIQGNDYPSAQWVTFGYNSSNSIEKSYSFHDSNRYVPFKLCDTQVQCTVQISNNGF